MSSKNLSYEELTDKYVAGPPFKCCVTCRC